MFKEFNYTVNIFDKKITLLYKLCRHISDQQQKDIQIMQRLVVVNKLSDEF